MSAPKITAAQIEALKAARDHHNAYRIADADGNRSQRNRYRNSARTRVVASLQRLGLLDGSQITDEGLESLGKAER